MKKKLINFLVFMLIFGTVFIWQPVTSYANENVNAELYFQMKPDVYINNTSVPFDNNQLRFIYQVSEDTENVVVTNIESNYIISDDTVDIIGNILSIQMGDNVYYNYIKIYPSSNPEYGLSYTLNIIRGLNNNNNDSDSSGGGGGGGGGSAEEPTTPVDTTIDSTTNTVVVSVSETQLASLFKLLESNANEVKLAIIKIPKVSGLDNYGIQLPVSAFTASNSSGIRLETDIGTLTLMDTMLQNVIQTTESQNVKFNLGYVDTTALDQEAQTTIGNHPIIRLTMELDGTISEWNNPNSPVIVSIPYTPTAEELANPDSIIVYYIDGNGNLNPVSNAKYDSTTGCVVFSTTHFSDYAIGYNDKTFTDITDANIKTAVEYLAANGIVNGKTETTFVPKDTLTRAEFITLIDRAFELNADFTENFGDVQNGKWYYESVGTAKKLDIVNGVGNDQFDPNGLLNKKQVEIIINNTLKAKGTTKDNLTALLSGIDDSGGITRDEVCLLVYYLVR